ncbi:MAG: tyrosine-type recombinase/integrase [Rhodoblastus sp.]|uniref:tyrosine-type recombinase/integrase n=1 Tax=Rhodoblastus sp. TaxID=1962975 RepID=UPI003F9561A8
MKLTQRRIDALECPANRRDMMVFDDEQPGLGVRVTVSGGKSFLAQYTLAGAKRRVPLGSCSAISLASAREAVRAILGDVARGRDPAGERKEAAAETKRKAAHVALSLDALLKHWEAIHLADKRQSYASEAVRAVRFAFEKQLQAPAADLDRMDVVRVLDALSKQGKAAMAARTAAYGRACYQWAVKRGSITANPFANLPLAAVEKRERVLTDQELRAVWLATAGPGSFNAIVRMLMLTGQRREEVAGMTWVEVAPDLSTWTIPASRAKNGVAHVVPLNPQAQAILAAATRLEPRDDKTSWESELVFPGLRGPFNGFGKSKSALDSASLVKDWRLHDLRRTMATGLQKLGVRLEVTEAVLNHVSGSRAGIIGIYQRHDYAAEKRAALTAWGECLVAIIEAREVSKNLTRIKARGV